MVGGSGRQDWASLSSIANITEYCQCVCSFSLLTGWLQLCCDTSADGNYFVVGNNGFSSCGQHDGCEAQVVLLPVVSNWEDTYRFGMSARVRCYQSSRVTHNLSIAVLFWRSMDALCKSTFIIRLWSGDRNEIELLLCCFRVATGSKDQTLQIWDAGNAAPVACSCIENSLTISSIATQRCITPFWYRHVWVRFA